MDGFFRMWRVVALVQVVLTGALAGATLGLPPLLLALFGLEVDGTGVLLMRAFGASRGGGKTRSNIGRQQPAVQPSTCKTIPQRGSHQADTLPFWKKAPLGSSLRGSVASMTAFCAPSCAERGPRCEVMSVSQ